MASVSGTADPRNAAKAHVITPEERKVIESSPEYKAISQDEKIQSILADQDLMDQIRRGEMAKVLSNSKIQKIFQDQRLVKKFLALESSILRKEPPQKPNQ